jgi:hypothetical protein
LQTWPTSTKIKPALQQNMVFSYSKKAMAHNACQVNFVVSSITIVGSFCKIGTFWLRF